MPFWLNTEYCKSRGDKKCINCESYMTCTYAIKVFELTNKILELVTKLEEYK